MQRNRSNSGKTSQRIALYVIACCLGLYISYIGVRSILSSTLLDQRDRINIALYGQEAEMVSIGLRDGVHYIVSFSHQDKVSVPGGYGRYNVGALGKLAQLEKNPALVGRTFSSMTSTHVDFSVVPKNPDVYSGDSSDNPSFHSFQLIRMLFSSSYSTNAHFIDKVYVAWLFAQRRQKDFVVLRSISETTPGGEHEFSERRFLKKYKGFFYHQSFREEAQEVGIEYRAYPAAVTLSRIIEGQGIRVVDLSATEQAQKVKRCLIIYSGPRMTKTAVYLQKTYDCPTENRPSKTADITLIMGEALTEEWK